ncbi:hypothetical protein CJ672_09695 [Arcobacter cryaerophilus gv. occultus]|uniref:glycosyltransferase n=1 Tax=Aliarcobacter cryaerophilus TaxID=28198 RepID=UPI000D01F6E0|nr:glycosyltransferase [Aliarcobacter cryaerophilus]PRM91348.1 hypothetical protein CJ672_09695 [Arcobacter cryaerophilus gv. occultus]
MISFLYEYFKIRNSNLFDKEYYLNQNSDVNSKKINPLKHFIKHGWKEGRNPSKEFDVRFYLNTYPDILNANINPLIHYINYGKKEGRITSKILDNFTRLNLKEESIFPTIPEWVIEEMKILAKTVDPVLYPSKIFLEGYNYYAFPIFPKPGEIYFKILESCTSEHYTHCFALPWLKRGGADYVALLHINLMAKQINSKVLVLLTEPSDSPWLNRIEKNVNIIDISKYICKVSQDDSIFILAKLLIQLKIEVLHIINSRHAWEVIKEYGKAITNHTKIFASLYCDDYDTNGIPVGYARDFLPDCYKYIKKVFVDNNNFPKMLCKEYGYPLELFQVLKSPIENVNFSARKKIDYQSVLWAGRLDRQKRPDILLEIVKKMQDIQFNIHGDSLLDSSKYIIEELSKQKNVSMMGVFDGVESLPFHQNSLFLYTSQWDGTPTMIIAAALASIPIVASNVGGIEDILSYNRGHLITDIEDIDSYVINIRRVLDNTELAENCANLAKEYILKEHSLKAFESILLNDDNYMAK